MKKLTVSYVGCGGMGRQYAGVYRDLDWVQVASCIDTDLASAQQVAATLEGPLATRDFEAALAPTVDTVIINTPNSLHRPQAVAAIEAGKNVLLQKPVAPSLEDAEAIAAAAARSDRTVGVYMSYFDHPLYYDLRDMAGKSRFGDLVHFYARLMHRGGMMWSAEALAGKPNWRVQLSETGGGCFIQLAVHYLHIFEWLSSAKVVSAQGLTGNLHCPGVEGEDLAVGTFRLDSGAIITIDTAWCADGDELSIHGTLGRANYRSNRWLSLSSACGEFRGRVVQYTGGLTDAFGGPVGEEQTSEIRPPRYDETSNPYNQHRLFLEAARDGRPAPVSIASGVRDLRIVLAMYESARTGRVVPVV